MWSLNMVGYGVGNARGGKKSIRGLVIIVIIVLILVLVLGQSKVRARANGDWGFGVWSLLPVQVCRYVG